MPEDEKSIEITEPDVVETTPDVSGGIASEPVSQEPKLDAPADSQPNEVPAPEKKPSQETQR